MQLLLLATLLFILSVSGCAGIIMPVTSGSQYDLPDPESSIVVWGPHNGAVNKAVTTLQQLGYRIVDRSRVKQVLDEQKIMLTHSTDDTAQLLKVGKVLGAGSIVFVEIETSSSQTSRGGMHSNTVTNVSVSARGVDVESSSVIWSGAAYYSKPINNPEEGIVYLTQSAINRGLCLGTGWKNDSEGCDWAKVSGSGIIGFKVERKTTSANKQWVVTAIRPNFPAEQEGLKVGDVILSCNGKSRLQTQLQFSLDCKSEVGVTTTLEVKRGENIITIAAIAVLRPEYQK